MAEHIILFVEGDTDEVLFKKIIARYKELANQTEDNNEVLYKNRIC